MSNRTLIDEFITLIHSEANNNPPPKSCKIVKNYGDEPYSDVEVEDLGILIYKKTIGTTNIGSEGIICFLNGDLNQSIVITDSITEIDLSEIYNALNDLDNSKSNINHLHPQYLTEHQDLSNYANRTELNNSLAMKVGYGDLFDLIYPVGSIYMSVNDVNPAYLFGGTWVQIKDKFLLASGESYSNGSSGGSADAVVVSHNHTQNAHNHTQNAHNHTPNSNANFVNSEKGINLALTSKRNMSYTSGSHYYMYTSNHGGIGEQANTANTTATNKSETATNNPAGVDGAGKNLPPYLAVNVWQRTE